MLRKVRNRRHAHLIRLLATFRYKRQFYLLFPYAKWDLRQYWKHNPDPEFSHASVRWLLCQSEALASGLHTVHVSTCQDMNSIVSPSQEHSGNMESQSDIPRYGRHGDIKPENILWFENGDLEGVDYKEGTLVITDFGLADLHRRATVSDIPASTCTGTPTYEPPEFQLKGKISRAYDVWCLGCIFLEYATWLVCGWNGLAIFPDARRMSPHQNLFEDTFYHIPAQSAPGQPEQAEICEGVVRWMAEMRDLPRCSAFVDDFLDLIMKKMLLVDPQRRASAKEIKIAMTAMLRKAEQKPSYLIDPKASEHSEQILSTNGRPPVCFLKDGTMPMLSTTEGQPLPNRNVKDSGPSRLRSVSPRIAFDVLLGV